MFACLHGPGNPLTALAFEFSPRWRHGGDGVATVTFDVGGLGCFSDTAGCGGGDCAAGARGGVRPNLAMAGNPDAAICAARGFKGVSLIPHGDEGKFLVAAAGAAGAAPQIAGDAGTLGAYGGCTKWGRCRRSASRSGWDPKGCGCARWRAAKGIASCWRSLEALHFEDEIELDYPVELLEPLAFVLARLMNGIGDAAVATRGLATDELRLRLKLETGGSTSARCDCPCRRWTPRRS